MSFRGRYLLRLSVCVFFVAAVCTAAFADGPHDRTQFGHDITIGPNEEISEATCFGCSIRVHGHVDGDITVFGGRIVIEDQGEVNGDATVFAGGIRLDKAVKVGGDVTVFGGQIRRDPASSVGGDVTTFGGPIWIFLIFGLPLVLLGAFIALIVWLIRRMTRPSVPATA
jgi:hypothetical protein